MAMLMGVIIKSRLLPPGPTEVTWDVPEPGLQAGPSDHAGIPPTLSEISYSEGSSSGNATVTKSLSEDGREKQRPRNRGHTCSLPAAISLDQRVIN